MRSRTFLPILGSAFPLISVNRFHHFEAPHLLPTKAVSRLRYEVCPHGLPAGKMTWGSSINWGTPIAGWFIMENPIRLDDFGVIALILGNLRLNDVSNEKQWLRNMNLSFLSIEIRLSATNMRVSQTSRSDQRSSDSEESEVGIHRKGGWAVASIHPTTSSLYSWFISRCLEVQFQLYVYIYISMGWRLGFPGSQLHFICMDMENVEFTLCFTVFYAFLWKCSISQTFNVGADKLDVCPRRKMIKLHLPWMAKHVCNILTIGIAVSCIFGRFVDN